MVVSLLVGLAFLFCRDFAGTKSMQRLIVLLVAAVMMLAAPCVEAAGAKKRRLKKKGSMRVKYRRRKAWWPVPKKFPKMSKSAAQELYRWFVPLTRERTPKRSLETVASILRTWIASRWGLRLRKKAWAHWAPIRKWLRLWSPAPLYRQMRGKWHKTRAFGKMKRNRFILDVPKNPDRYPSGRPGRAGLEAKLLRLKRMRFQKRRPYRLMIDSFADIPPVYAVKLDTLLASIIKLLTTPDLDGSLPAGQRKLFIKAKGKHSRRVANWLTTRFVNTAHLLDYFLNVPNILEPIGKDLYKLDLRGRWKIKSLIKYKPSAAKSLRNRSKTRMIFRMTFYDKSKRRQWLVWTFHRKTMEHRFQAVFHKKGGLMLCNKRWRPVSGPWRPTQMGIDWFTDISFQLMTRSVRFKASDMWFQWRVRKTAKGASLGIEMIRQPTLKIKGGEVLRLLARVLIPGGVERIVRWFLRNMAHGDQGRGFRMVWDLQEHKRFARIFFRMRMPVVPSRMLTSILRVLPSLMRQQRRRTRRGKYKRKKGKRRRRRRLRSPLWQMLYTSIIRDILRAKRTLAVK